NKLTSEYKVNVQSDREKFYDFLGYCHTLNLRIGTKFQELKSNKAKAPLTSVSLVDSEQKDDVNKSEELINLINKYDDLLQKFKLDANGLKSNELDIVDNKTELFDLRANLLALRYKFDSSSSERYLIDSRVREIERSLILGSTAYTINNTKFKFP